MLLAEIMKEDFLDAYLDYFYKDSKKFKRIRILFGICFFLIYTMIVLMVNNTILFIGIPLVFYIGYKIPYINLMLLKRGQDIKVSFLFPQFLQSFLALLSSSGNVYQALKNTIDYTSEPLKRDLKQLVASIEKENKRDDYILFAEKVGTNEAYMILDMIYKFSEFGIKKEAIQEMANYIQNLQENKIDELIGRKIVKAEKVGVVPILISLFLVGGFTAIVLFYYMDEIIDALNVM